MGAAAGLAERLLDQQPCVPGKNVTDVSHQSVQQVGKGEERKKRRQEQQRREEGEDEVVREGGAAVQDIIVVDVGPHPLGELDDRQAAKLPCRLHLAGLTGSQEWAAST